MKDLRNQIAAAISVERFAAQPHELGFIRREEVDRETDRIMRVVQPVARSCDAYRDERDQAQRERDLAVWLHAEAVWQRDQVRERADKRLVKYVAVADELAQLRASAVESLIESWRPTAVEAAPPLADLPEAEFQKFRNAALSARGTDEQDVVSPTSKAPQSNECGCPGSGTHAHVQGCRPHPDGAKP